MWPVVHELRDLVADRLADARHLRRLAGTVGGDEVDRAAPDRVGRAVVGDGLEDELALDLEHVADLVEDPGERAVGQLTVEGVVRVARRRRGRVGDLVDSRQRIAAMVPGIACPIRARYHPT